MTAKFTELDNALRNSLLEVEGIELTPEQALEFLRRYRGNLAKQKLMLMHEVIDCGCADPECQACTGTGMAFTEVFEDDISTDESLEEFVSGFDQWRVWTRG